MLLLALLVLHFVPAPDAEVHLQVFKTGLLSGKKHDFVFDRYSGEAVPNERVRFEIDTKSIRLLDTWVSEKDRKKILELTHNEMLASDKFPKIVFDSTSVQAASAEGNLTIRGITKPAKISFSEKDGVYEGRAEVNMRDFGLKPPTAALGTVGTKEIMILTFRLKPTS